MEGTRAKPAVRLNCALFIFQMKKGCVKGADSIAKFGNYTPDNTRIPSAPVA